MGRQILSEKAGSSCVFAQDTARSWAHDAAASGPPPPILSERFVILLILLILSREN